MRKTLAVAAREIQERWLLLAGALALGFVPLVIPHLDGRLNRDAVAPVGLVMAILIGGFAAILAGGTVFARDAEDGRLAFLLGKPVSWPVIWSGKWIGAFLLAGTSGLLAAIPWMAVYPPETAGGSWLRAMADPQGWAFAVSIVVLIVGLANFAATAYRARSAWLVVDFALLLVALWAIRRYVAPLFLLGIVRSAGSIAFFWLAPLLALLLGSAAQLAVGRTDVRRAHRALSIGFWAVIFSLLVAAAGWLTWVEAARPADLDQPMLVDAASDGRWLYVMGRTSRGGYPGFLLDAASGRHLHVDVAVAWSGLLPRATAGRDVSFSADSRWAVRWRESRGGTGLTLVDLRSEPPRPVEVQLESSAPPTWWTDAALSRSATTALLVQESAVSLFALPSGRAVATNPVPPGWRVGAARFLSEDAARVWLEPWEPGRPPSGPGEMRILDLARGAKPRLASFATRSGHTDFGRGSVANADGTRLLTLDAGLRLRDGASGAILATLVENAKVKAARFLADGRIAALGFESGRVVMSVFAPDGTLQKRIDLDRATGERGLGPQVGPGRIVISTGTPLPFPAGDSLIVDLAEERVVERLQGLRPVPRVWHLAEARADPASPVSYFADKKGQVVRIDFATGERRVVAGPGAPRGERLKGL